MGYEEGDARRCCRGFVGADLGGRRRIAGLLAFGFNLLQLVADRGPAALALLVGSKMEAGEPRAVEPGDTRGHVLPAAFVGIGDEQRLHGVVEIVGLDLVVAVVLPPCLENLGRLEPGRVGGF